MENALVVDKDKILNKDGLRNENEFVNHKILDLAGDFLLSGFRILGNVKCHHGGHELTNKFLRKLLNIKTAYEHVEVKDVVISEKITRIYFALKGTSQFNNFSTANEYVCSCAIIET